MAQRQPEPSSTRVVLPAGVPGRTKAERVNAMFARIVPHYDLMNRLMTFGMDGGWRRAAVAQVRPRGGRLLDVGTGTGDLAQELRRQGAASVVGVDFVAPMLARAADKHGPESLPWLSLVQGDALHLPFADASFDGVISGFLLRNVADLPAALTEMARVLRPGARLVSLELTHPPRALAPAFHLYFDRLVPALGGVVTGEPAAYRYLPASLGPLPTAPALARLFGEAGLRGVRYRRLGLGTVAIHVGVRAD
jgi:demethylmenaquinone methyltransferase/2-methoxy-6-polyprenyl-1,4-benzoquinol methylase